MTRSQLGRWLVVGALVARPARSALGQSGPHVSISPFAGVEFRSNQNPLFGLSALIRIPAEMAGTVAVSTVRSTGVWQLEVGLRWPAISDAPVTPYVGGAFCLLRWPSADLAGNASWRPGAVATGGIEARAGAVGVFGEAVAVTDGTWAFQLRAGLRLQAP